MSFGTQFHTSLSKPVHALVEVMTMNNVGLYYSEPVKGLGHRLMLAAGFIRLPAELTMGSPQIFRLPGASRRPLGDGLSEFFDPPVMELGWALTEAIDEHTAGFFNLDAYPSFLLGGVEIAVKDRLLTDFHL